MIERLAALALVIAEQAILIDQQKVQLAAKDERILELERSRDGGETSV